MTSSSTSGHNRLRHTYGLGRVFPKMVCYFREMLFIAFMGVALRHWGGRLLQLAQGWLKLWASITEMLRVFRIGTPVSDWRRSSSLVHQRQLPALRSDFTATVADGLKHTLTALITPSS